VNTNQAQMTDDIAPQPFEERLAILNQQISRTLVGLLG
jgi:hypothetical protein